MKLLRRFPIALIFVLAWAPVLADDLTGADNLLCTAVEVNICFETGECDDGPPWNFNIPQFIEIDLEDRTLSTTQASGENRSTPIKHLQRADGIIVIQGFENERAFSFLIGEESGILTVAVARDGIGVTVFGACTPLVQN